MPVEACFCADIPTLPTRLRIVLVRHDWTRDGIYLDHASAAPIRAVARGAMNEALDAFGDPIQGHSEGKRASGLLAPLALAAQDGELVAGTLLGGLLELGEHQPKRPDAPLVPRLHGGGQVGFHLVGQRHRMHEPV